MSSGNAYYPDASVVCEYLERDPQDDLSMTNPSVLVEVLSPSTEQYDRTDKLLEYQTIPSLKHTVHVAHADRRVDFWTRNDRGWLVESVRETGIAPLAAIGCELDIAALYRDPLESP